MFELSDVIMAAVITLHFLLMVIGTFLRWDFLVDPPESWKGYSHTFLKKIFGKEFLTPFNYIVGTVGFILGMFIFIGILIQYLQQK